MVRNFLSRVLIVWGAAPLFVCGPASEGNRQPVDPGSPNIVLIMVDDMGYSDLGCYGGEILTPHIDRLAAEGVTFTRCCANSPVCMATRASLITGKYVNEHGVWSFADEHPEIRHGPSYVRNIRDAGYHTAVIGKKVIRLTICNGLISSRPES